MLCKNNEVVGMIDFADLSYSHLVYDIGITLFYMLYDRKEYFTIAESFL